MNSDQPKILHWIDNVETAPLGGRYFDKKNPVTGEKIAAVAAGSADDAVAALKSAAEARAVWSGQTPVARGKILRVAAALLEARKEAIGAKLSEEGGLSKKQGLGEVGGIVEHAHFWAGEGRRFYGRTMPSKTENRLVYTVREPVGVTLVIAPANTPFAGRAVLPALLCGNAVVLKPSEDMPSAALELARALKDAGLPPGVFNVVQGLGAEAGAALVADPRVDLISFTGSVAVGKNIEQAVVGRRDKFVKLSLELGGKNALVVSDDADLDAAVASAILSAFSLAGQRCAAASRIIVLASVYEEFKNRLVRRVRGLKLGTEDADDLGPLVNERQLERCLKAVSGAVAEGGKLLCGGARLEGSGYFMEPTLIEGVSPAAAIAREELFGPVALLFKAENFNDAIRLANDSPYGLTAAIQTKSLDRAQEFARRVRAGTVHVNGNTYGSEPHMPFGGYNNSGNGTREAGVEALEIYSQLKTVTITHSPARAE